MTDTTPNPDHVCHITSITDDDGKAACLMQWGRIQAVLEPDVVYATARELMSAAASAETDAALIRAFREELAADDQMIGVVLSKVREKRPMPTRKCALRIQAIATLDGRARVGTGRGSMEGQLSPDEARVMAVQWIETAVASQIDVRLRYALGEWNRLDVVEIDELFGLLRKVAGS